MKLVLPVACITLLISLSGCTQDYSLAPPAGSEQMTITVKVPEELEAETLQAAVTGGRASPIAGGIALSSRDNHQRA